MKKTVLITGAAGFLGSHLCDYFLSKNNKVIGLDNLITGSLKNLSHLKSNSDFEFRKIDITENFNVAPDFNYSINEMAKIALEVTEKDYEIIYDRPDLDGQFRKDVSNKKLLKIFPDFKFTSLKEGLKQVYDKIS